MRVGIVGAGVAGLAAARKLTQSGHEAVVFEAENHVGGRAATERLGAFVFDTAATSVCPRGKAIEAAMLEELDKTDLVRIERPIYVHQGRRTFPGDPAKSALARYVYRPGIQHLAKLLAEGLDVWLGQRLGRVDKTDKSYMTYGSSGESEEFDAIVLTAPVPETREFLERSGVRRPLDNAAYRPVISILLGYDKPLDRPFHAVIDPEQVHPLTWLSVESLKSPGRAPDGQTALVAQMSAGYSRMRWESSDELILRESLVDVSRLLGQEFSSPTESAVRRWKHAQPEQTAIFERVNPPGTTLVIAGDGVMGGRIEYAYETGIKAAELLMA